MTVARCETCDRSFARNEHLIRHQRIHTGERPFPCPYCRSGFQRADVRAKHIQKLHPEKVSAAKAHPPIPAERPPPKDMERSRVACDQCRRRKLKCSNSRPCDTCRVKSVPCTVSRESRPPGRPRNLFSGLPGIESTTRGKEATGSSDSPQGEAPWINLIPAPSGSEVPNIVDGGEVNTALPIPSTGIDQWISAETTNDSSALPGFHDSSMALEPMLMDDILPQPDFGSWLDELDDFLGMDGMSGPDPAAMNFQGNPSMENAVDMMKDHFLRRSRASSPSREEQKRSWYSTPPDLYIYDQEVINVLLNLARRHIASTFTIFADFEVKYDTQVELCLAMAAVGGLYCTAQDSAQIAKMLFNDARRLLLEHYLHTPSISFDLSLSFAKTFILLEIYGLCSGDKRAYEFTEAFHANELHAAACCVNDLPPDIQPEQRHQAGLLLEALQVMDSYRVLLLQRPPSLFGSSLLPSHIAKQDHNLESLPSGGLISSLGVEKGHPSHPPSADMHHLTKIICYSWIATPQNVQEPWSSALWKVEFVENALNGWLRGKTTSTDPSASLQVSQMVLYHVTQVSLHSNLRNLQRLTQAAVDSALPLPPSDQDGMDSARAWRNSHHFDIAQWNAKETLRIVRDAMSPSKPYVSISAGKDGSQFLEAPHMPLCIYFATLVLWYGEVLGSGANSRLVDASIESGSRLLFRLKVPVSNALGSSLCELLTDRGNAKK